MAKVPRLLASGLAILIPALILSSCAKSSSDDSQSPTAAQWVQGDPFPHLATAASFAVLAGTSVANSGASVVYGNIGVSPGRAISGISSVKMTGGKIYSGDTPAGIAQSDAATAYHNLISSPCTNDLSGQDLGGMTLRPGTYCFSQPATLTGLLTLDSGGDSKADFVFLLGSTLTVHNGAGIRMINGGEICNVFWSVDESATVGAGTTFIGSIIAGKDIALQSGVKMNGKAIARTGKVTMDSIEIYDNTCPYHPFQ